MQESPSPQQYKSWKMVKIRGINLKTITVLALSRNKKELGNITQPVRPPPPYRDQVQKIWDFFGIASLRLRSAEDWLKNNFWKKKQWVTYTMLHMWRFANYYPIFQRGGTKCQPWYPKVLLCEIFFCTLTFPTLVFCDI